MYPRVQQFLPLIALIVGCSTPEVLEPRPGIAPSAINFSGKWLLRSDKQRDDERIRKAIRITDGVSDEAIFHSSGAGTQPRSPSQSSRLKGGLVYIFLETGSSLQITQTSHGLFISFDRAVVEEFRFGEDRLINIGEVEVQRVTGWEENELVVETLDKNSMKMTERFKLTKDGLVLHRTISLRSRAGEVETFVQLFDKVS